MPWRIKTIILTLVIILTPTSFKVYANQGVYISEVNFAGSTRPDCKLCSYDKWIELFNPSQQAIDVSFWTLQFRESQDATNNLKFPPNTFIQAKSNYLVRNRYNGLTSTLTSANIQADAISGKVLRVSSNTAGQRRVQASLLNSTGQKISEFNLNESAITRLEHEANLVVNSKFSIEFNPDNSDYKISEQTFFTSNYGSPKFSSGALLDLDKSEEVQVQPVISPNINLVTETKPTNIQAEIKFEANPSVVTEIPVKATVQQSINKISEVATNTPPQINSQYIPQPFPQYSKQITSQENIKTSPQVAPNLNSEVPTQAFSKNIPYSGLNIKLRNHVLPSPHDVKNIALQNPTTVPLDYGIKLSEIKMPQISTAEIYPDSKLTNKKIEQADYLYSSLVDKININLWPLVLFMLASIACQKYKTISNSASFVNVLTKNLTITSN